MVHFRVYVTEARMLAWLFLIVTTIAVALTVVNVSINIFLQKNVSSSGSNSGYVAWVKRSKLFFLFPLITLTICFAIFITVNLYFSEEGESPYSPERRKDAYRQIKEKFATADGEIDFHKYEVFLNRQFELLHQERRKEPIEHDFVMHVYFLETWPKEEVRSLGPLLKEHASSNLLIARWGRKNYLWPFYYTISECGISLGTVCNEVLQKHRID